MKIVVLGDMHLRDSAPVNRVDDFLAVQKRKFMEVVTAANTLGAPIVCVGDVFDVPTVSLRTLSEYVPLFQMVQNGFYVVPGNHDLYGCSLALLPSSGLGVLEAAGCVRILSHTRTEIANLDVYGTSYFHPGSRPVPDSFRGRPQVLVTHSMVLAEESFKEVDDYQDALTVLGEQPWDLVFCGHYHYRFVEVVGGRMIANPGAMVRIKASKGDMAMTPGYLVVDPENPADYTVERFASAKPSAEVFRAVRKVAAKPADFAAIDEFVSALAEVPAFEIGTGTVDALVTSALDTAEVDDELRVMIRSYIDAARNAKV